MEKLNGKNNLLSRFPCPHDKLKTTDISFIFKNYVMKSCGCDFESPDYQNQQQELKSTKDYQEKNQQQTIDLKQEEKKNFVVSVI